VVSVVFGNRLDMRENVTGIAPVRGDFRKNVMGQTPSRLDFRQNVAGRLTARADLRQNRYNDLIGGFDMREITAGKLPIRLDFRQDIHPALSIRHDMRQNTAGRLPARIDIRQILNAILSVQRDRRQIISGQLPIRLDYRQEIRPSLVIRRDLRQSTTAQQSLKRFRLAKPGWAIYARNLADDSEALLGFVDADASPKMISDVALADGDYEITARASNLFWHDARDGKCLTVSVSGGVVSVQKLPAIANLRREIRRGTPRLMWSVENDYDPPASMVFGIWISGSTPVVTSGDPDYTVPYFSGQADYFRTYTQATSQYAAVAAKTDTETGPVTEIEIAWSTTLPNSPPNQTVEG